MDSKESCENEWSTTRSITYLASHRGCIVDYANRVTARLVLRYEFATQADSYAYLQSFDKESVICFIDLQTGIGSHNIPLR